MPYNSKTAAEAGKKSSRAGVPNKATTKFKELGAAMMNEDIDRLKTELSKLEGKDYVDAYCKLIEYFAPKLSRQEVKADVINKHEPVQMTAEEAKKYLDSADIA